jgi:cysteine-rich repeat protein
LKTYQCDDGNTLPLDGCSATCTIETGFYCAGGSVSRADVCDELCDDGSDWHSFECDYGAGVNGDGCSTKCEIEIGFFCYRGMPGSSDTCFSVCGDGRTVGTEVCDDGNANNGVLVATTDGCANCNVVTGWYCWNSSPYTPSYCAEICGDGRDFFHYGCDDGNNVDGDGCD